MRYSIVVLILIMTFFQISYADSLFQMGSSVHTSMFSDRRARTVGDLITIKISENTNSSSSGRTEMSKKSTLVGDLRSFLFPSAAAPGAATDALYSGINYLGSRALTNRGTMPSSNWNSESDFEGDGSMSHSETLAGTISAMIIEVLPNGNFIVEGKRSLKVDKQERVITISGIVRPQDVGADNMVLSEFIADAKIQFDGSGPLTSSRKRGLLKWLWDVLGPY